MRISFWILGFALGLLETIASRFSLNVDGISYLDLGRALWTGDRNAAVNGYWSPLYAWLIGGVLYIGHVPPYWESTVVHAVNFLIFLVSMAAFEFLLYEICNLKFEISDETESVIARPLPGWALRGIGYSLCLYAGLVWISIWNVTPDQIVVTVMYLVAAMLLRMNRSLAGWGTYALFGALLGVGYLNKAALLPLGLVSLGASVFLAPRGNLASRIFRSMLTAAVFAVVAAPLVIALSLSKERLTSGETGKIAYAEVVDDVRRDGFWTGEGNVGTPKHAVRKAFEHPDVFEFATPVGGTYPPWYDTSYWFDGLTTHFDLAGQMRAVVDGMRAYAAIALQQFALIGAICIFCVAGSYGRGYWRRMCSIWPVWIASVAGLGMFALVLVETRYVGSFLVILAMCFLAMIRQAPSESTRRLTLALTVLVAAVNLFAIARVAPRNAYSSLFRPRSVQWEVAQALANQGVVPGDRVATIIDHRLGDYWAHLDEVRIVEDIPFQQMSQVASLSNSDRSRLLDALRAPGAKVIVTTPAPPAGTGFHWRRLGNTEYFDASLMDSN